MNFSAEYSFLFVPLCILFGIACASIIYWKMPVPNIEKKLKILLFVCRSLAISLIALLLIRPLMVHTQKEVEKPIIAMGIDNSSSIAIAAKNDQYQVDFQKNIDRLVERLSKKYQVETYLLGEEWRKGQKVDFSDKSTNLSAFFDELENAYYQRNLGAVVLFSDGIFNTGSSPLYVAEKLPTSIYTMALGDTTVKKDLLVAKVNYNKTVYLNNIFPIEVLVKADKLAGKTTLLTIYENNKKVHEQSINITSNEFSKWVKLSFEAKKAGLLNYRVELSEIEDEVTTINNHREVVVEVLDSRKKVAIVYQSPHPDIAAIVSALQSSEAYQVETFVAGNFNGKKVADYDMVVMHRVPSNNADMRIVQEIEKAKVPCFYVLASMKDYHFFNDCHLGMAIDVKGNLKNTVYPILDKSYSGISFTSSTTEMIDVLSPVEVPFGKYRLSPNSSAVLLQKIGEVETNYPLLVFSYGEGARSAIFFGDGLWRWRLYDYMYSETHDQFDELILKVFQYIGTKENQNFFRVSGKQIYAENEEVIFDAELYNMNYELVNEPEVQMTIQGENGTHQFLFSRVGRAYQLEAGIFPKGTYKWEASTNMDNKKYSQSGYFTVKEVNLESVNLTADYQLMVNLAAQSEGRCFSNQEFDKLYKAIVDNETIKSVAHYNKTYQLLSSYWPLLLIIVLLLSVEWFIRKYSGAY